MALVTNMRYVRTRQSNISLLIKSKLIEGLGLGDVCTFQKNSYFNFLVNFLLTHFGNRKLRIKNDTIVNKNTITTL